MNKYRNYFKFYCDEYINEDDKVFSDKIFTYELYEAKNLKEYDPDGKKYLHSDLKALLQVTSKFEIQGVRPLFINKIRCSSDVIGPSRKQLLINLTKNQKINALRLQRTLGAHILFPVNTPSINTIRGNKMYLDRIDLCLQEIRNFYCKNETYVITNTLWNIINKEAEYFKLFGDGEDGWKNFITIFCLEDFVDEKYEVIDLLNTEFKVKEIYNFDTLEKIYDQNFEITKIHTNPKLVDNETLTESEKKNLINTMLSCVALRNMRMEEKLKGEK